MIAGSLERRVAHHDVRNLADNVRPDVFLMSNSFETGGSERQFAALARTLDSGRFRLHLGCIRRCGPFLDGLGEVPEFRLGGSLYGVRSWRTRGRLAAHLRRHNIALAHAYDLYTNLTLIPAARMAQIPVVVGSLRQLGDLLSRPKAYAQLAMFHWCDAVVCNSRAAAGRLLENGFPERKLVVIRNGLPASAFAVVAPSVPRTGGVFRIAMIGRMNERRKNHGLFLRATARLLAKLPCAEILIVGDGPLLSELEVEAQVLRIGKQVRFLGERQDIPGILASVDVSVVPSISESLSNVILESMAAGVPVIASEVGGNPEIVTSETGMLVAPDDERALAEAMEHLLRNGALRREMGCAAQAVAKTNFTAEQMGRRYEELYWELLAKKGWRADPRLWSFSTNSRKLHVAVIAPSPRYVGGQSMQTQLLLRSWQNDPRVQADFISIDPPWPAGLGWVERIPFLRTLVRTPLYLSALRGGLRDTDVAHIFSASYWSFLLAAAPAWLMARRAGAKTVIHYHSGEAPDHLRKSRAARLVLRQADRLVVPSGYLENIFQEFHLAAEVVPNLVDLGQFRFRERRTLQPRLLCTRGFHPYYAVDVVVRAFAEVQQAFPQACLDLVGKGRTEEQIRELVSELDLSGVNLAGAISWHEMPRFYDAADVFVNASWLDNMPVSILEAFACGLPVVTTGPPGIRYFVEHGRTGLLSEPGNVQALAENVLRLLREPDLGPQLARNAYEEVRHYTWPAVREKWIKIYSSLQKDGERTDELIRATVP